MISVAGKANSKELLESVQTSYILQKLDNFNPGDQATFWQRSYVSTLYWDQSYGPVFVYVGGEEELFPGYLMAG